MLPQVLVVRRRRKAADAQFDRGGAVAQTHFNADYEPNADRWSADGNHDAGAGSAGAGAASPSPSYTRPRAEPQGAPSNGPAVQLAPQHTYEVLDEDDAEDVDL